MLTLNMLFASGGFASPDLLFFLGQMLAKGLVVLALIALVLKLIGARSAALRHAAWTVAFGALLALPIVSALAPAWSVPGSSGALGEFGAGVVALGEHVRERGERAVAWSAEALGGAGEDADVAAETTPAHAAASAPPAPTLGQTHDVPAPAPARIAPAQAAWSAPSWLLRFVGGAWLAGVLLLLGHLAIGLAKVARLLATAEPVGDARWLKAEREIRTQLALPRVVDLRHSEDVEVPMTIGVLRPVVLLPQEATAWTEERCRIVLLHEMAHIKRGDYASHLLVMMTRALHWPNPLAWWAAARHVMEREHACDDLVLNAGIAPTSYADELVSVARDLLHRPAFAGAALPMARPSELRARVRAILDQAARPKPSRLHLAGVTALVCALLLPLAAFRFDSVPEPVFPAIAQGVVESEAASLALVPSPPSARVQTVPSPPPAPRAAPLPPPAGSNGSAFVGQGDDAEVDSSRVIREAAVQAIGQLAPDRAIPLLARIIETETSPNLREKAVFWLSQQGTADVLPLLERVARTDADAEVRERAIFAIGQIDGALAADRLVSLAQDVSLEGEAREAAVFWLSQRGSADVLPFLEQIARTDTDEDVRDKAVFAIGQVGGAAAVERLAALAQDTRADIETRKDAAFWLGDIGGVDAIAVLTVLARGDAEEEMREKAVFALSQVGGALAFDALASLARDASVEAGTRERAVFWLGQSGDPRAGDLLVELLGDGN